MSASSGTAPLTPKEKFAHAIALWFGCGLSPIAPGTVGAIGTLPLYFAIVKCGGGTVVLALTSVVITLAGVWSADVVARVSKAKDPQKVVVDEVAGTLIALTAAPFTWRGVVLAVVLFRFFDIVKPGPVRAAERLPGGWGIVLDDVVAGLLAAGIVLAARLFGVLG